TLFLPNKNLHYATCCKQFEHDITLEALRAVAESDAKMFNREERRLLDRAAAQVNSYREVLRAAAGRFGGISILGSGFTIRSAETPVAVGLREDKDVNAASETLEEICSKGIEIRIVVDDPEQVFSASRELDTHLVGGFCLAALRLSQRIRGLKIVVLLK